MIEVATGDIGASKTHFCVNKILYPRWLSGVDIYSNTLLLFTDKFRKPGTNIIDNPLAFSWIERKIWNLKFYIYDKIFSSWLYEDNIFYNPDEYYFWKRNKELLKMTLFNFFTIPPSRGNIIYFNDVVDTIGAENGTIFMDEGSEIMDARNWEHLPAEFSSELRQSRKNGLDLLVTTQEMTQIDKNYRRLIQSWYECKRTFFTIGKRLVILGRFKANLQRVGDYLKSENANTENIGLEILKSFSYWITIFKRRKYDTNYKVTKYHYKLVNLNKLKNNKLNEVWAIVPKKTTYREIIMKIQNFRKTKGLLNYGRKPAFT